MQAIRNNLHLRIISFILTLTLFLFVRQDEDESRSYRVELDVVDVPARMVLLNEPGSVTVSLRGTGRALARLDSESLRHLEIGPLRPDTRSWQVRPEDFELPTGIVITNVSPPEVPILLDRLEEVEVHIEPNFRGELPEGYRLFSTTIEPPTVRLTAPSSVMADLTVAHTEAINLDGLRSERRLPVELDLQRRFVTYPREEPIFVRLEVGVAEDTLDVAEVDVQLTGERIDRCRLVDATVSVSLSGPESIVDEIDPTALYAAVTCAEVVDRGPGLYTLSPILPTVPASVAMDEMTPRVVRVEVLPPPEVMLPVLELDTEGREMDAEDSSESGDSAPTEPDSL
jgi:YbbR domain-containing protein